MHYTHDKTNQEADDVSRYPTLLNELNLYNADFTDEILLIALFSNDGLHSMAITLEEIAKETRN